MRQRQSIFRRRERYVPRHRAQLDSHDDIPWPLAFAVAVLCVALGLVFVVAVAELMAR